MRRTPRYAMRMTRSEITIRRLGPGDIALTRKLNVMFGRAFDEPDTYGAAPPSDDYFERLLSQDHIIALVALAQEEVVAGLVAYRLDKFEQARSEIYLYDLAVAEEHRRRGLATALIDRLREIGAETGAWVVFVQADYGDDPAVALYDKLGLREEVMHFDIAVERDEKRGGDRQTAAQSPGSEGT